MASHNNQRDVRRAQKESLFLKEISQLFHHIAIDDPKLSGLAVNRVRLSADKSICFVLFYSPDGKEDFDSKFEHLKLYKPSMRKALSQAINARYTPELVFQYDEQFEKQDRIENLISKLKNEGKL